MHMRHACMPHGLADDEWRERKEHAFQKKSTANYFNTSATTLNVCEF